MTETAVCPFCESDISPTAKKCGLCGEWVSRNCQTCGTPIRDQWAARGFCADCGVKEATGYSVRPNPGTPLAPVYYGERKSQTISVGLALALGGIGAHKFYLDKPGLGILYMMFAWTGIPSIIGIFEAVKYIRMDEGEFQERFLRGDV